MKLSDRQAAALKQVHQSWGMDFVRWLQIHHRTRHVLHRRGLVREPMYECLDDERVHGAACRAGRGYPLRLGLIVLTEAGLEALREHERTRDQ